MSWIKTSERLPENASNVFVKHINEDGELKDGVAWLDKSDNSFIDDTFSFESLDVFVWMPIPELPSE